MHSVVLKTNTILLTKVWFNVYLMPWLREIIISRCVGCLFAPNRLVQNGEIQ